MTCSRTPCGRDAVARGFCSKHYQQARKSGELLPDKQPRGLSLADRFSTHFVQGAPDECWEWQSPLQDGYGHFKRKRAGSFVSDAAHRVALELHLGRELIGWALHDCDNRACVNPAHLYEGDALLNSQDAVARQRYRTGPLPGRDTAVGVRTGNAKLTDASVLDIRSRYAEGSVSQQELADEYGVHQTKISAVVRRKTWKHI